MKPQRLTVRGRIFKGRRVLAALAAFGIVTASVLIASGAAAQGAGAGSAKPDAPGGTAAGKVVPYVILRADEVTFDEKAGLATATGNVEIAQGQRLLRADRVTYSEKTDTFTATGNVAVVEPNGDVIFGDHGQFSQQFKNGFVEGFRMLFLDNSRLAATGGRRVGGVVTTLGKGVFSACDLCKKDPSKAPLWRIRAVRVIHDSVNKEVEYKDAFLEMFGVPVAYLPYFSHADPSVKRRTGLLVPSYATSSDFGSTIKVPFFWAINPSEDLTLTPVIYSGEEPMLAAIYRKRFARGAIEAEGSYTRPDKDDGSGGTATRGHLLVQGKNDIDAIWRAKYQMQYSSDDTYIRRYDFDEPDNQTLTTSLNLEGFKGHNYAQLSGYYFQGLRADDDPGQTPLVLPFAEYHYVSKPGKSGSYLTADTSLLSLTRGEGTDSHRISLKGGWHLPHTAQSGEVYELSASLQGDLYWVDDVTTGSKTDSGLTGRVFPQFMAKWRYPFVRRQRNASQLIEPVAALVLAPNGGNPSKIPNEDSVDVEFDDTNLFASSRFTGVDRVDGGQRFVYGLNWGLYGDQGGAIEAFVGQSYQLQTNSAFAVGSGLDDQTSDLVGRIRVSPGPYLNLLYRFRLDHENLEAKRNEVKISGGPSWLRANVNYFFVDEETGTGEFGDREEITLGLAAKLGKYWRASGNIREDLTKGGGTISQGIGLQYKDECFIFNIRFKRTFTEDRDLEPTDTVFFQLIFKHLGGFESTG
jgi:LPS-assembly protein